MLLLLRKNRVGVVQIKDIWVRRICSLGGFMFFMSKEVLK